MDEDGIEMSSAPVAFGQKSAHGKDVVRRTESDQEQALPPGQPSLMCSHPCRSLCMTLLDSRAHEAILTIAKCPTLVMSLWSCHPGRLQSFCRDGSQQRQCIAIEG